MTDAPPQPTSAAAGALSMTDADSARDTAGVSARDAASEPASDPASNPGRDAPPILRALAGAWALLLGVALLMLGNGLQGSLLGLRATQEGFGDALTGVVMAGFFLGFLIGARWTPPAIRRVGHVRVFAALGSIASFSILAHAILIDPVVWALMRLVAGVCFAGVFVVAESWLNERADNQTRGQLLSIYMATGFLGMAGGQALLNVADTAGASLFMLASMLISLAFVPALLSAAPAPTPKAPRGLRLGRLYEASPLGVVGTFGAGVVNGALFGMGAVVAQSLGLGVLEVSAYMAALILGGALGQWPIGKLSDLVDRRLVITGVAILAGALAVSAYVLADAGGLWRAVLGAGAFGAVALSLHALALAYTNDYLETTELVGASGGLVLIFGAGSTLGPVLGGAVIQTFGPGGFFWALAVVLWSIAAFALYRMTVRQTLPSEEQGPFVAMTAAPSAVAVVAAEETHAAQMAERQQAAEEEEAEKEDVVEAPEPTCG